MADREKVVEIFSELRNFADNDVHQVVSPVNWHVYSELRDLIDEAEADTITLLKEQEEKKGQWIPIESPTGVEAFGVKEMAVMYVRCSVCGSEEDVSFTGYKHCPRCGAKMEGSDDMSELQKPPIGLKPRWIHDSQRAKEILEAIERYTDYNMSIPKEWIDELKDLFEDLFENYFK